ncbi:hypothetical protein BDV97DRAFT_71890 [Delphinella strobiligena]|nr:hypothetical protein BDV97DRAFT_71890 [Delphinella strobiligena]
MTHVGTLSHVGHHVLAYKSSTSIMPFRERIRRAFRSSSPGSDLRKASSQKSESLGRDARWPSNVYAPGEPMPRPKYRAPVKKEHKEKLESFNWGSAWRRRSYISEYSPMGSRMPSRRNSLTSRKSFGGSKIKSRHAARPTRLSAEIEAEGDDDVTNVGLSRVQSREKDTTLSRQLSAQNTTLSRQLSARNPVKVNGAANNTIDAAVAHDHQPFTEEELALAMKRSHLTVPKS